MLPYTQNVKQRTGEHVRIANMPVSLQYDSYFTLCREAAYRHCFQFSKLLWCFCLQLTKYVRRFYSVSSQFVQAHIFFSPIKSNDARVRALKIILFQSNSKY